MLRLFNVLVNLVRDKQYCAKIFIYFEKSQCTCPIMRYLAHVNAF